MNKIVTIAAIAALASLTACTSGNEPTDAPTDAASAVATDAASAGNVDPALLQQCDSQTPTAACDTEEVRNAQYCEDVRKEAGLTGQPVTDPKCK